MYHRLQLHYDQVANLFDNLEPTFIKNNPEIWPNKVNILTPAKSTITLGFRSKNKISIIKT